MLQAGYKKTSPPEEYKMLPGDGRWAGDANFWAVGDGWWTGGG